MPESNYDKWIKMSEKLREKDVSRQTQTNDITKYMKRVLPEPSIQRLESRDLITRPSVLVKRRRVVESFPDCCG